MKIKTQKHFYFIFAILSFLIAGIFAFFIKINNLPFEFRVDEKGSRTKTNNFKLYNDLNSDGISERISFLANPNIVNDYIQVHSQSDVVLGQYNLFSKSNVNWLHIEDYNMDNFKDIFIFSQLKDTLFLSIIDVKEKLFILDRQFIFQKPDSAKHDSWDIIVNPIGLLNVDTDKTKELIFTVFGAHTIYPRGIYSYDIEDKKIINQFESGSVIEDIKFYDLNNDGEKELIASTIAPGNMVKQIGFHDHTKWLFVFNKNLEHFSPPKSFGTSSGKEWSFPIEKDGERNILVIYDEHSDSVRHKIALLFSEKGEFIDSLKNYPQRIGKPIIINYNGKDAFYFLHFDGLLIKADNMLQNKRTININGPIEVFSELEINLNNEFPLLARGLDKIYLISKELDILGRYPLNENFNLTRGSYSIKLNGVNKLPQLSISGNKSNFLFTIIENKISTYLPLIFLVITLFTFLLFVGIHKLLSFLSTYIKYFSYSLNKSSHGIAMLSSSGNLFYFNTNMSKHLNTKEVLIKGENYRSIFRNRKEVISAIENSRISREIVNKEIHISTSDYQFEGLLSVTPFTSFIGYTYAYLMEVSDFTEPLLTDRGKVWGATLQRIAHEIKTPLSTLILSLDNLKNRLAGKDENVNNEILMMQNELERIKHLTKNFMMFTNLEKQLFEEVSLSNILDKSINNFRSYFEKGMVLNFNRTDFHVLADERQLSQLFPLLIENAIDACDGKGKIDISRFER